jgi:outer membrane protein assembly factor BamE (lipoprotein component of BamABCDE complex)
MAHAITIGMTKAQVTKAIGEPDLREDIEHKEIREVWKYDLEPAIRFQVNFDAKGRVVGQVDKVWRA